MRERSHRKGEIYQSSVKSWLDDRPFLGYDAVIFGDIYDISCKATEIGGHGFDISMHLKKDNITSKILYIECKYREETTGHIDSEFLTFLVNVYDAMRNANPDDARAAEFCFISNIYPSTLHIFFKDQRDFLRKLLEKKSIEIDDRIFEWTINQIYILIINNAILGVN